MPRAAGGSFSGASDKSGGVWFARPGVAASALARPGVFAALRASGALAVSSAFFPRPRALPSYLGVSAAFRQVTRMGGGVGLLLVHLVVKRV